MACELFKKYKIQEARRIVVDAFVSINDAFSTEVPATLSTLFQLAISFHDTGSFETAKSLVRQCCQCFELGELHKPKDHPLIRICEWLASLDSSQFQEVLTKSLRSVGDNFEKSLGLTHQSTFDFRLRYIYSMSWGRHLNQEVINFEEKLATTMSKTSGEKTVER